MVLNFSVKRPTRGRRLRTGLGAFALAIGLNGCGSSPENNFFPLEEDLSWEYRVLTKNDYGTSDERFSVTNIGERWLNGKAYAARRTSDGTEYLFAQKEDGVFRVGKRLIVELEAQTDIPERMVLPQPPEPGKLWNNTTRPYLLRRLVSDGVDMRRAYTVQMNYSIEATDETVKVPAGEFTNCIKVLGEADLQMYVDGPTGMQTIPLVTEEWYARGVGLVKMVRTETVTSNLMAGGTAIYELMRYTEE